MLKRSDRRASAVGSHWGDDTAGPKPMSRTQRPTQRIGLICAIVNFHQLMERGALHHACCILVDWSADRTLRNACEV